MVDIIQERNKKVDPYSYEVMKKDFFEDVNFIINQV